MFQTALARGAPVGDGWSEMPARSSIWLVVIALASAACSSGQTGSPDCVGAQSCVCDPLYGAGTLLRVQPSAVEAGQLRADVEEVFAPEGVVPAAAVGDRVGGSLAVERPCAPSDPSDLKVGTELLVLYSAGFSDGYPNCPELQKCQSSECAAMPEAARPACWANCEQSTYDSCQSQRERALLDGYFAWAVPFEDPLDFGGEHRLSPSELSVLQTPESCYQRFPAPPAPPCEDTRSGLSCRAAPPARGVGEGALSAALALLVLAAFRRRERQSGRAPRL